MTLYPIHLNDIDPDRSTAEPLKGCGSPMVLPGSVGRPDPGGALYCIGCHEVRPVPPGARARAEAAAAAEGCAPPAAASASAGALPAAARAALGHLAAPERPHDADAVLRGLAALPGLGLVDAALDPGAAAALEALATTGGPPGPGLAAILAHGVPLTPAGRAIQARIVRPDADLPASALVAPVVGYEARYGRARPKAKAKTRVAVVEPSYHCGCSHSAGAHADPDPTATSSACRAEVPTEAGPRRCACPRYAPGASAPTQAPISPRETPRAAPPDPPTDLHLDGSIADIREIQTEPTPEATPARRARHRRVCPTCCAAAIAAGISLPGPVCPGCAPAPEAD